MLQRKGDQFLMEAFIAAKYSAKDLAMLNQCRTFLKAVTLADISKARGDSFAVGIYNGVLLAQQSQSTLEDPFQERPSAQVLSLWQRFLRELSFDKKTTSETSRMLASRR